MVRIDERVARVMAQLRSPAMAPFLDYLRAQRQETLEQLTQAGTDTQVYRLQGEAGLLKHLLESIEKAEALLQKLKQ